MNAKEVIKILNDFYRPAVRWPGAEKAIDIAIAALENKDIELEHKYDKVKNIIEKN